LENEKSFAPIFTAQYVKNGGVTQLPINFMKVMFSLLWKLSMVKFI